MARGRPRKTVQIEDAPVEVETVVEIDEKPQEPAEEETKIEKIPEKEPIKSENTSKTTENVEDMVATVLKGNNRPNGPPTIVRFASGTGEFERSVILYINHTGLELAWATYKENSKHISAEEFLGMVYRAFNMDIPRVYNSIFSLRLD